jgi:hypothetical protein
VPTPLEEVVVEVDAFDSQRLGPKAAQCSFYVVVGGGLGACRLGRRGRTDQGGQECEHRRDQGRAAKGLVKLRPPLPEEDMLKDMAFVTLSQFIATLNWKAMSTVVALTSPASAWIRNIVTRKEFRERGPGRHPLIDGDKL